VLRKEDVFVRAVLPYTIYSPDKAEPDKTMTGYLDLEWNEEYLLGRYDPVQIILLVVHLDVALQH
jgi:hypothetical protein